MQDDPADFKMTSRMTFYIGYERNVFRYGGIGVNNKSRVVALMVTLSAAGLVTTGIYHFGKGTNGTVVDTSQGSAGFVLSRSQFTPMTWTDSRRANGAPFGNGYSTSPRSSTTSSGGTGGNGSYFDTVSGDVPTGTQASENWAGYVATPQTSAKAFTSVHGSWTVPTLETTSNQGVAAQWVGLGGVNSDDLLQVGTIEQVEDGQVVNTVFWEKLPSAAKTVMTVEAGSTIDASVKQASGTTWDVVVTVTSPDGQTQTKTIPVTLNASYEKGIGTSAEWISEDPSTTNGELYPLANAGTVAFSEATVDGGAINAETNDVVPMAVVTQQGQVLISPSQLGSDGESFSTTTLATSTGDGDSGQFSTRSRRHHGFTPIPGGTPWAQGMGSHLGYAWR